MVLEINNKTARRLWLNSHGLIAAPTGPLDVLHTIKQLGFVQLDTIQNVVRAHHHILWSRNQKYREPILDELLKKDRTLFEHFTHDASIIPMDFYPMWRRQFKRLGDKVSQSNYYRNKVSKADMNAIKNRIREEGPLSTQAFDTKIVGEKKMWSRPPHKLALDHMWYSGELTTSHRESFRKYYDLAERIIPPEIYEKILADENQIEWLCRAALDRLNFGTLGEIQKFWAAMDRADVKTWSISSEAKLVPVKVEAANGDWVEAVAAADIEDRLSKTLTPSSRLRILNPFDPAIRDRTRLQRLFGFNYRNEMFVPAAKRQWGYYVYPILEGDKFVGRIDLKADRKRNCLIVEKFWVEPTINWTAQRSQKLKSELQRFASFAGLEAIDGLNAEDDGVVVT
ncbi:MAG: crosslink repair DNA glycosylase YcaQ family protein [Sneathiella sp.]